jgi:hypothetical protein
MAFREIISVSFEIHTAHTNALCWPHRSEVWLEISCRDNTDERTVTEWVITNGGCTISGVLQCVTLNGTDPLWKQHNAA